MTRRVFMIIFCVLSYYIISKSLVRKEKIHSCDILESASHGNVSKKSLITISLKSVHDSGAILTVWGSRDGQLADSDLKHKLQCQIDNHNIYCKRFGYVCYFLTDTLEWRNERRYLNLPPHWVKIQALIKYLPIHRWIFYLDYDTIFVDPMKAPSIESVLDKYQKKGISVQIPHKIWNCDKMFFWNTEYSKYFINHIWNIRHYCPNCVGEQGAAHVALFDFMIAEAANLVRIGKFESKINVSSDNHLNCCNMRLYCEYPTGNISYRNPLFSVNPQGCTWNWQKALRSLWDGGHPDISFDVNFMTTFNLLHPVKEMNCEKSQI